MNPLKQYNNPVRWILPLLCLPLLAVSAHSQSSPEASEIVKKAWENFRGLSSYAELTMTIHRPDWERSVSMRAWTRGQKHSLVRVTAPRKDAGSGTLMLDSQMWTYAPKINRVIKVPSSMMSQSWMGSDFSNKDVSRADDIVDQYSHKIIGEKEHDGHKVYVIEAIPNEDSAVVWGKEVLEVRDDGVLLLEQFYDQDGELVKSMETLEVGEFDGRTVGTHQRMAKVDSEGEWTEVRYDTLDFGVELADSMFTHSNLRNPRQ